MRSLKVLGLLQLPPPIHGAALRNQDFINSEVVEKKCDFSLLEIQTAKALSDIGGASVRKFFSTIIIVLRLFIRLLTFKPDVVYITLNASGLALIKDSILVSIALSFNTPVVCHMRNRGLKKYLKKNIFGRPIKFILRKTHFVCMSPSLALDVSDVCESPSIISNCLTLEPFIASDNLLKERCKSKKIVYLSNISEEKGALLFLDFIKAMREVEPNLYNEVSFDIYGPFSTLEEETKFFSHCNSLGPLNINLMGPIYGEEKFNMLKAASLLVFPTMYSKECFPGVIMEAFCFGVPVLACRTAAIPEIIDDGVNGFVLDRNPYEYAKKAASILGTQYEFFSRESSKKYEESMCHTVVHEDIISILKAKVDESKS